MDNFYAGFIIGLIAQMIVYFIIRVIFCGSGRLKIDRMRPGMPKCKFEFDESIDSISKKRWYVLTVDSNADLSSDNSTITPSQK